MTDGGFSLVETLVAMAVLAVASAGLVRTTQAHIDVVGRIEARTAARWVAENRLAEVRLGLPLPATVSMLGRVWTLGTRIRPSTQPGLQSIDVAVGPAGAPPLVTLRSFREEPSR